MQSSADGLQSDNNQNDDSESNSKGEEASKSRRPVWVNPLTTLQAWAKRVREGIEDMWDRPVIDYGPAKGWWQRMVEARREKETKKFKGDEQQQQQQHDDEQQQQEEEQRQEQGQEGEACGEGYQYEYNFDNDEANRDDQQEGLYGGFEEQGGGLGGEPGDAEDIEIGEEMKIRGGSRSGAHACNSSERSEEEIPERGEGGGTGEVNEQ